MEPAEARQPLFVLGGWACRGPVAGKRGLLNTVWLSLLVEPGAMLRVDHGGGALEQYGYVLQATEWGVLALDVVLQKIRTSRSSRRYMIANRGVGN